MVENVYSSAAVDFRIRLGGKSGGFAPCKNLVQPLDDQCRMSFFRWAEVFLDSQVHLRVSRCKPATTASRQRLRFRNLFHAEHIAIKTTRAVLAAFWHGELYMVNAQNPAWSFHPTSA